MRNNFVSGLKAHEGLRHLEVLAIGGISFGLPVYGGDLGMRAIPSGAFLKKQNARVTNIRHARIAYVPIVSLTVARSR